VDWTTGELLLEQRMKAGLTQDALAERAGISVRTIQRIEADVEKPHSETVRKLAKALGVRYAKLIGKEWDELEGGAAEPIFINPTDPEGIGRYI
jgi:transcriptional regulator with XRE-family HTH domain